MWSATVRARWLGAARAGLTVAAVVLCLPTRTAAQSPDRPALEALYHALGGAGWTDNTNWLGPGSVSTWFGVTTTEIAEEIRVTAIDLPGNNLTGNLPVTFGAELLDHLQTLNLANNSMHGSVTLAVSTVSLPNLQVLTLSGNQFTDLNGLSQSETLQALNVQQNLLTFEDLEPLFGRFTMHYSPQGDVGPGGVIVVDAGDTFQLNQPVGGSANQYQWFLNGNPVPGETSETLTRTLATSAADAGAYVLKTTSTIVPGLTLMTPVFSVTVNNPVVNVSPSAVNFGSVRVGTTQAMSTSLGNTGAGALDPSSFSITGTNAADFVLTVGGTTDPLATGSQRDLTLEFTPGDTGLRTASLVINSNAPDSPHTVDLSGTGTEAVFGVSPAPLSFSDTDVGSSRNLVTTITNTGSATMNIASFEIGGANPGDFEIIAGNTDRALDPLQTHNLTIEFSPGARGDRQAVLTVNNDAPGNPHKVGLDGSGLEPPVTLDPNRVDFGDTVVGQSETRELVVRNDGPIDVEIVSMELRSVATGKVGGFSITSGADPGTLTPGQERTVEIAFEPAATGTASATLVVSGSDHDSEATVEGSGVSLVLDVDPGTVDFGGVELGQFAERTVTISNPGTANVVLSSVVATGDPDFLVVAGGEEGAIEPGGSRQTSIRFSPTQTGDRDADLVISSNLPDSPTALSLQGEGTQAATTVSPTSLDFGEVSLPGTVDLTFTLQSTGTAPLRITNLQLGGDGAFQLVDQNPPTIVDPGESHTYTVRYAPGDAGTHSGTVTLTTNAPNSPHSVSLAGSATALMVEITPEALDFGEVAIGSSNTMSVVIANTGSVPLEIVSMTLTGHADFQVVSGGAPGPVPVGANRNVALSFAPVMTGDRTAGLIIESNAPGSPHTVSFSGVGTAPEFFPSPGGLDFMDVEVGSAATLPVTIENRGTAPMELTGFQVSGDPDFELVSGGSTVTLHPTGTRTVELRFTPVGPGGRSATLIVTSNAAGSPHQVPMIGTGIAAELTTDPVALGFGQVRVGTTADLAAEIRNTGTAPLQLTSVSVVGTAFSLVSGGQGGTLLPGQTRQVGVRFGPLDRGAASGSLEVTSSAGTASVTTTGSGIGPALELDPTTVSFGNVEVGVHATMTASLRNVGETEASFTLTMGGADAAAFGAGPSAGTVAAGQAQNISVAFRPVREGDHVASLSVGGNALGPAPELGLTGSGTGPTIVGTDPGSVTATVGSDVTLSAQLPTTFQPEVRELCFRLTGATEFECVPLTQDGTSNTGLLPAGFVTERGVDYYFRFVQGGSVFTDPAENATTNPYRLRVAVPPLVSPEPVLPRLYGMFSVPLVLDDPSAETVLAPFGPPDPLRWRLLRWNAELQQYDEHPAQPLSFEPCQAFWFVSGEGGSLQFGGGTTVDPTDPCQLLLLPGWNQIGNPYAFPILWSGLDLTAPVDLPVGYDPAEPGQDPYAYNQQILEPWGGYWVNNPGTSAVQAVFSPVEASLGAVAGKGVGTGDAVFTIRLTASLDDLVDSENYVGFAADASAGYDAMDFAEAPGIGEFVRLSVLAHGRRMAGEFRGLGDEGARWDLEIGSSLPADRLRGGRLVRVRLDQLGDIPPDFEPIVLDEDLGRRIPLIGGGFDVVLTPDLAQRRVLLIVGTAAFASDQRGDIPLLPTEASLGAVYPNPTRSSARISYQIPEPGTAELTVFDALGRRVRTLVSSEVDAGWLEARWNGRDDSGQLVSSGLYFVQLRSGSSLITRQLVLLR